MKIALAQISTAHEVAANQAKITQIISELGSQADLVIFPENSMSFAQGEHAKIAQPIDGEFASAIIAAAAKTGVMVIFGMLERGAAGEVYNTIICADGGKIIHRYSKTHLYDAFSYQESKDITASQNAIEAFDTRLGRLGVMVCYELRFPEIARTLALGGAELIVVPTAWFDGRFKDEHLQTLCKCRALENTVYLAMCTQTGGRYSGRSAVIDPLGIEALKLGTAEGVAIVDVDFATISKARETVPCLHQRHPELYRLS